MTEKVKGWKPRLSKGPITPAVDYNLVLPMFVETKPATKAKPASRAEAKVKKPKKEKVLPETCPDCFYQTLYETKNGPFCSQCSKK